MTCLVLFKKKRKTLKCSTFTVNSPPTGAPFTPVQPFASLLEVKQLSLAASPLALYCSIDLQSGNIIWPQPKDQKQKCHLMFVYSTY